MAELCRTPSKTMISSCIITSITRGYICWKSQCSRLYLPDPIILALIPTDEGCLHYTTYRIYSSHFPKWICPVPCLLGCPQAQGLHFRALCFNFMFYVRVSSSSLTACEPVGQPQLNLMESCWTQKCKISGNLMKGGSQGKGSSREEQDCRLMAVLWESMWPRDLARASPASKASVSYPMRLQRTQTQISSLLEMSSIATRTAVFFCFCFFNLEVVLRMWCSIRRKMQWEAALPGRAEQKVLPPVVMLCSAEQWRKKILNRNRLWHWLVAWAQAWELGNPKIKSCPW